MTERWHHVRTEAGFEIHDENGLMVASMFNPQHDREDDARLIADAPRLRERLNLYDPDVTARKAALVKEQVEWNTMGWFSSERAKRFHRGVRVLAKRLGRDTDSVLSDIWAEAKAIIACDEESGS